MKRLLCTLLAALVLLSLCACADKKGKDGKDDKKSDAEQTVTQEEILTAPDKKDPPTELGTLPIIFGDDDEEKNEGNGQNSDNQNNDNSGNTSTQKPPATSSSASSGNDNKSDKNDNDNNTGSSTVIETPIIPFN